MTEPELKPCAHCGHEAIMDGSASGKSGQQVCMTFYYVVCTFCNIKTSYERSKQIAIKLWNKRTDKKFGEGFDAAIEMVINSLDQYDSNELATMSVWDFIEKLKDDIIEEAEAYKNDK